LCAGADGASVQCIHIRHIHTELRRIKHFFPGITDCTTESRATRLGVNSNSEMRAAIAASATPLTSALTTSSNCRPSKKSGGACGSPNVSSVVPAQDPQELPMEPLGDRQQAALAEPEAEARVTPQSHRVRTRTSWAHCRPSHCSARIPSPRGPILPRTPRTVCRRLHK